MVQRFSSVFENESSPPRHHPDLPLDFWGIWVQSTRRKDSAFSPEGKFCGRIVSAEGIKFDSRHLEALVHKHTPSNGAELQQLLCACNWMRTLIPAYSTTVTPPHQLLKATYEKARSRTKNPAAQVGVADSCGRTSDLAFATVKKKLPPPSLHAQSQTLTFVCLWTHRTLTGRLF